MSKKTSVPKYRQMEEGVFDPALNSVAKILSTIRVDIKHKNETQKKLTQAIKANDGTICTGPAGTGKTYIAVGLPLVSRVKK